MLDTLAAAGSKALGGARFTLTSVLPSVILVFALWVAVRSGTYDAGPVDLARVIPTDPQLGQVVALALAVFLIGVLIQPFQVALVQVLEGFGWAGRVPAILIDLSIERHLRRRDLANIRRNMGTEPSDGKLADAIWLARGNRRIIHQRELAEARFARYPKEHRVQPTMLGNVLRAGEDVAGGRYGFDSMVAFPRMFPSISARLEGEIAHQLRLIDTTSALCVAFLLAGLATAPMFRTAGWPIAVPVVLFVLALFSYSGALRAAKGHGTLLATAFDLHRFDIATGMHLPLPRAPLEEVAFNRALSNFLGGWDTIDRTDPLIAAQLYRHPPITTTS